MCNKGRQFSETYRYGITYMYLRNASDSSGAKEICTTTCNNINNNNNITMQFTSSTTALSLFFFSIAFYLTYITIYFPHCITACAMSFFIMHILPQFHFLYNYPTAIYVRNYSAPTAQIQRIICIFISSPYPVYCRRYCRINIIPISGKQLEYV